MDTSLLIGWQDERAELRAELSRLEEELADSRADRLELESRAQALTERLTQSLDPHLSSSLLGDSEHREWRRKLREGKERETRQALLIHKLQNKVLEYRSRCQRLEQQVDDEGKEMRLREKRIRDEHSDSLESALIRLEEEQQRSVGLVELNTLLRNELSQSAEANESLREDLRKLTGDWSRAVEEAGLRESDWLQQKELLTGHISHEHTRLMTLWGRVVTLRRQCNTVKTATDKDLWELRAEFSRLSSSLLISCASVRPLMTSTLTPDLQAPRSSSAPPLSSDGPLSLGELGMERRERETERVREREMEEMREQHEAEKHQLRNRIAELSLSVKERDAEMERLEEEKRKRQSQEKEKEEESEREWERNQEMERNLESVQEALSKLSRVLTSRSGAGDAPLLAVNGGGAKGLPTLLSIIAQAESSLQWKHQELQDAEVSVRRLTQEREVLEKRVTQLQMDADEHHSHTLQSAQELRHTHDLLQSEKEMVASLRAQVEEGERHLVELRRENETLRRQREREEEERRDMERERQKRLETEAEESARVCERESRSRMELHGLQGELEREQLERARSEREAAEHREALSKARESVRSLSSCETLLKRELAEARDALDKMAALNQALATDKRELSARTLQLETEIAEAHVQLQGLGSEVTTLRRELKTMSQETTQLSAFRDSELDSLQLLREREQELEREMELLREERDTEISTLTQENHNHTHRIQEVL
ncbi:rootletin-like [Sardina pilchardus]|uniref:rootletin-like n=1 Tax=Sardina pilchardus TaxID=27697 RepID=UPI002E1138D4